MQSTIQNKAEEMLRKGKSINYYINNNKEIELTIGKMKITTDIATELRKRNKTRIEEKDARQGKIVYIRKQ